MEGGGGKWKGGERVVVWGGGVWKNMNYPDIEFWSKPYPHFPVAFNNMQSIVELKIDHTEFPILNFGRFYLHTFFHIFHRKPVLLFIKTEHFFKAFQLLL